MEPSAHQQIAAAASMMLRHPQLALVETPSPRQQDKGTIPVLCLEVGSGQHLRPALVAQGCSNTNIDQLLQLFRLASAELAAATHQTFGRTVAELANAVVEEDESFETIVSTSLVPAWIRQFHLAVANLEQRFVHEVSLARQRHSTPADIPVHLSPTAVDAQPSGAFTEEVLSIMNRAFLVSESVSRAERRELSRVTGLSERQVLTWFANQRQRRPKKAAIAAATTGRAAPYTTPRRAQDRQRHPAPHSLRTVSGSSSLSCSTSSSLLSYAHDGEDTELALFNPPSPIKGDSDFALLPASAGASFASFASQYQVDQLPIPPPYYHDGQEAQSAFDGPTPLAPSFSLPMPPPTNQLGFSSFDNAHEQPLPSPAFTTITSSEAFFDQTFSQPVVHEGTCPASESSSISCTEDAFSSSSSISGFVPVVPASAPFSSFGQEAGGLTSEGVDSWMDSQFYENLFGSLGLTGPADGAGLGMGMGMSIEGGGLRLSMDAVRADAGEEGMEVGGGGGFGW
ncbi:hypothetical protein JCM11641_005538 [Rhodosporidiobolus odoratus]